MDYTRIPHGASVFAHKVCEEKAALYARYKESQEKIERLKAVLGNLVQAIEGSYHSRADCLADGREDCALCKALLNASMEVIKR